MFKNTIYRQQGSLKREPSHPGGFIHLLYTPLENIAAIGRPDPNTGIVNTITFANVNSPVLYHLQSQPAGRFYSEDVVNGDGGPYYNISCGARLPFNSQERELLLHSFHNERYIVIVSQNNGVIKLMGSLEEGAKVSPVYHSGTGTKGVGAHSISWEWQSCERALLLNSNLLPALLGYAGHEH